MITAEDIKVIYSLSGDNVTTRGKLNYDECHPRVLQFTQEEYDALDDSLTMEQKALELAGLPDSADVRLMIRGG